MRSLAPPSPQRLSPSRRRARHTALALLGGVIVATGTAITPRFSRDAAPAFWTPRAAPDSVRIALMAQLRLPRAPAPIPDTLWGRVRALYDTRPSPLWVASSDGHARAEALLDAITWAPEHGLQLPSAAVATLRAAYATLARDQGAQSSARVDVLLTAAFILYTDCMLVPVGAPERSRDPLPEDASPDRGSDEFRGGGWLRRTMIDSMRGRATGRSSLLVQPRTSALPSADAPSFG